MYAVTTRIYIVIEKSQIAAKSAAITTHQATQL